MGLDRLDPPLPRSLLEASGPDGEGRHPPGPPETVANSAPREAARQPRPSRLYIRDQKSCQLFYELFHVLGLGLRDSCSPLYSTHCSDVQRTAYTKLSKLSLHRAPASAVSDTKS